MNRRTFRHLKKIVFSFPTVAVGRRVEGPTRVQTSKNNDDGTYLRWSPSERSTSSAQTEIPHGTSDPPFLFWILCTHANIYIYTSVYICIQTHVYVWCPEHHYGDGRVGAGGSAGCRRDRERRGAATKGRRSAGQQLFSACAQQVPPPAFHWGVCRKFAADDDDDAAAATPVCSRQTVFPAIDKKKRFGKTTSITSRRIHGRAGGR